MKTENPTLKQVVWLSGIAIVISLATLVVGVLLWFQGNRKEPEPKRTMDLTVKTTDSAREQVTMTDNSKVWLDVASEIRYSPDYREERRAQLSGQAYLKIKMQPEGLFTLDVEGMKVFTYGATFLADSYLEKEKLRVLLYAGELKIQQEVSGQIITVRAGTEYVFHRKSGEMELNPIRPGVKGPEWIMYKFEYTTFDNILYAISQFYGVVVNNHRPELNNETFSLSFKGNATLDEVMETLKTVSSRFIYRVDGNELIIN